MRMHARRGSSESVPSTLSRANVDDAIEFDARSSRETIE
jgi:hypothetical protein